MQKVTHTNLDADESIFLERQLQYVKKTTYDVEYPEYKIRSILPVSEEAGPGADTIKYEQFDRVGIAQIVNNYSDDSPRVDIKGKEFISPIRSLAASYGYSVQEIRAAKFAGKPLQQRKADAAKEAIRAKENQIGFFGDTKHNLAGFVNHANISEVVLAADGNSNGFTSTKRFAGKTSDQILRDLNALANTPIKLTLGRETPDTLLLTIDAYTLISSTPRSANSDTTILSYFLKNNPFIKNVDWLNELAGAGAGGVDRAMVYKRDARKVTFEVPQDFEQFPEQPKNLEWIVPCHSRCGGVIMYYPLSVAFADGI
jgi:hypothetical protein